MRISQIREFSSRAEIKQSRSTALLPFHATIGIIASIIMTVVAAAAIWKWDPPSWFLVSILVIFGLVVVAFLCVYVFFLLKES